MLRVYGVEGCGPCELTKMFFRAKQLPFEFVDVASAPDKRRELKEKLGSPTGGVILEDGDRLEVMQGVSVAKLSRYLAEYQTRHPLTP
jgi:glutaredoxin-like protein NrdH